MTYACPDLSGQIDALNKAIEALKTPSSASWLSALPLPSLDTVLHALTLVAVFGVGVAGVLIYQRFGSSKAVAKAVSAVAKAETAVKGALPKTVAELKALEADSAKKL